MNTAKLVDGDKTRRKRLKVVSACGECRRKKTKCNGEKPCAGCLKAHVECKYVFTQKSNTIATSSSAIPSVMTPTKTMIPEDKLTKATSSSSSASTSTSSSSATITNKLNTTSIESIEERLEAIENILRALLGSGKNKHLLQGLQQQQQPNNQFFQQHSESLCGDMYSSSSSPHLVHAPHTQNRRVAREKRKRHEQEDDRDEKDEQGVTETKRLIRDDFGHGYQHNKLQLAPIKIINNHQHTSGTPTIKNLLNEEDTTRWYPQNKSSAFFRMSSSSPRLPNDIINTNSATTAAGSSS
ncbi:hypothetical protein BD770DRAFT_386965 [Pilaira anomala]|nr:hypothetical protein BD770DRAFT_386965 [Pilaira anomala]